MLIPDENYKKFSDKLTTSRWGKKGFRLPDLRIYAKNILKEGNWEEYLESEPLFFEDVMMHSFVIAGAPIKIEERFLLLENFFPLMDNWSFVDSLCSSLKEAKKYHDAYWSWLQTLRNSENPFVIRFIYVMYLSYFLETDYLEDILSQFEQENSKHYYIRMAIAWALSIAFIKNEKRITDFFISSKLPKWTHNKAIQKTRESLRVDKETKIFLNTLKK